MAAVIMNLQELLVGDRADYRFLSTNSSSAGPYSCAICVDPAGLTQRSLGSQDSPYRCRVYDAQGEMAEYAIPKTVFEEIHCIINAEKWLGELAKALRARDDGNADRLCHLFNLEMAKIQPPHIKNRLELSKYETIYGGKIRSLRMKMMGAPGFFENIQETTERITEEMLDLIGEIESARLSIEDEATQTGLSRAVEQIKWQFVEFLIKNDERCNIVRDYLLLKIRADGSDLQRAFNRQKTLLELWKQARPVLPITASEDLSNIMAPLVPSQEKEPKEIMNDNPTFMGCVGTLKMILKELDAKKGVSADKEKLYTLQVLLNNIISLGLQSELSKDFEKTLSKLIFKLYIALSDGETHIHVADILENLSDMHVLGTHSVNEDRDLHEYIGLLNDIAHAWARILLEKTKGKTAQDLKTVSEEIRCIQDGIERSGKERGKIINANDRIRQNIASIRDEINDDRHSEDEEVARAEDKVAQDFLSKKTGFMRILKGRHHEFCEQVESSKVVENEPEKLDEEEEGEVSVADNSSSAATQELAFEQLGLALNIKIINEPSIIRDIRESTVRELKAIRKNVLSEIRLCKERIQQLENDIQKERLLYLVEKLKGLKVTIREDLEKPMTIWKGGLSVKRRLLSNDDKNFLRQLDDEINGLQRFAYGDFHGGTALLKRIHTLMLSVLNEYSPRLLPDTINDLITVKDAADIEIYRPNYGSIEKMQDQLEQEQARAERLALLLSELDKMDCALARGLADACDNLPDEIDGIRGWHAGIRQMKEVVIKRNEAEIKNNKKRLVPVDEERNCLLQQLNHSTKRLHHLQLIMDRLIAIATTPFELFVAPSIDSIRRKDIYCENAIVLDDDNRFCFIIQGEFIFDPNVLGEKRTFIIDEAVRANIPRHSFFRAPEHELGLVISVSGYIGGCDIIAKAAEKGSIPLLYDVGKQRAIEIKENIARQISEEKKNVGERKSSEREAEILSLISHEEKIRQARIKGELHRLSTPTRMEEPLADTVLQSEERREDVHFTADELVDDMVGLSRKKEKIHQALIANNKRMVELAKEVDAGKYALSDRYRINVEFLEEFIQLCRNKSFIGLYTSGVQGVLDEIADILVSLKNDLNELTRLNPGDLKGVDAFKKTLGRIKENMQKAHAELDCINNKTMLQNASLETLSPNDVQGFLELQSNLDGIISCYPDSHHYQAKQTNLQLLSDKLSHIWRHEGGRIGAVLGRMYKQLHSLEESKARGARLQNLLGETEARLTNNRVPEIQLGREHERQAEFGVEPIGGKLKSFKLKNNAEKKIIGESERQEQKKVFFGVLSTDIQPERIPLELSDDEKVLEEPGEKLEKKEVQASSSSKIPKLKEENIAVSIKSLKYRKAKIEGMLLANQEAISDFKEKVEIRRQKILEMHTKHIVFLQKIIDVYRQDKLMLEYEKGILNAVDKHLKIASSLLEQLKKANDEGSCTYIDFIGKLNSVKAAMRAANEELNQPHVLGIIEEITKRVSVTLDQLVDTLQPVFGLGKKQKEQAQGLVELSWLTEERRQNRHQAYTQYFAHYTADDIDVAHFKQLIRYVTELEAAKKKAELAKPELEELLKDTEAELQEKEKQARDAPMPVRVANFVSTFFGGNGGGLSNEPSGPTEQSGPSGPSGSSHFASAHSAKELGKH